MGTSSSVFVQSMPFTEEEMLDICNTIVRRNSKVTFFNEQIEVFEQLVEVMKEYRDTHKRKINMKKEVDNGK